MARVWIVLWLGLFPKGFPKMLRMIGEIAK
jgi:hypothetical protein